MSKTTLGIRWNSYRIHKLQRFSVFVLKFLCVGFGGPSVVPTDKQYVICHDEFLVNFSLEKPSRQAQRTLAILGSMMLNLGNSARAEGDAFLIKNEPINAVDRTRYVELVEEWTLNQPVCPL